MSNVTHVIGEHRDIAVLVAVDSGLTDWPVEDSLAELERLANTAGVHVVGTATQKLKTPHARTFLGTGKIVELSEQVKDLEANVVIFDDELSPRQQSTIEKALGGECRVMDRTGLILDIFAMHANTREGKLQVELATLEYELPRLRGLWAHLEKEKLGGGVGARFGTGESQLETDRRLARKRISELKRELKVIERERQVQRGKRQQSGIFRIALVGYTNAGKSTLLNALTGSDVLAYDKLFATLDSTTRRFNLPSGRATTLTDTVGFINKLPHGLVAAFKSTLDEVNEADLLMHVVDAGSHQRESLIDAVRIVLEEIGAHGKPTLMVFNKIDTVDQSDEILAIKNTYVGSVCVSARDLIGLDSLCEALEQQSLRTATLVDVVIPYTRGDLVKIAHEQTTILSESYSEQGTLLSMRVPAEFLSVFLEYKV